MIKRDEMEDDFYKTLGVERSASQKEIQKAYRLLARKSHPDLAEEGDKEQAKVRFQKIQEAYDCLSDPEKRQMYDQFGSSYNQAGGQNPFQGFGGGGAHTQFDFSDLFGGRGGGGGAGGAGFEDIFRQFGGGSSGPRSRGPIRGANVEHEITVPFRTAIKGGQAHLSVQRPGGKTESITVKVPAGIEDLKKIRLTGQGDPSPNGGPAGDLMIRVKVASHPIYRRQGNNLLVSVPITLAEAALGAKVDIPTPHGTLAISIPPGSSSGKKLRLKGQGVTPPRGTPGDLIVELQIKLPESYTEENQKAIEALQTKLGQSDVRSDLSW
jgi:DnaJ-class molecular chaperone